MTIQGIDVGVSQGAKIDWVGVAASGKRFAMIRCGNGNDGPDPDFDVHVAGALAAGIFCGAYHVAFPLPHIDPVENARAHFAASKGLGSTPGTLPPALDVEWPLPAQWAKYGCGAGQIRAWCLAYLDECARLHACTPMIYTYPDYWENIIAGPLEPRFASFLLWMANYQDVPGRMSRVAPWTSSVMRQISGGKVARLPGGAPVDEDIIADEDSFSSLLLRPQPDDEAPDTTP